MDLLNSYLKIIEKYFPKLPLENTRLFTDIGQFNNLLFVNDDVIFRFPKYKKNCTELVREYAVLKFLQDLKTGTIIPDPVYSNISSTDREEYFLGYVIIPGKSFDRTVRNSIAERDEQELIAAQLSDFLTALHSHSTEVPGIKTTLPSENIRNLNTMYDEIKKYLFSYMDRDTQKRITRNFEYFLNDKTLYDYAPVLIHGDFGGSNILYDESQKIISGIIDFSSCEIGDRAYDFASVSTLGEPYFSLITNRSPFTADIRKRADFYRSLFALEEALHGYKNNDEKAFRSRMADYISPVG